jgi:hypothetical protein
MAICEDCEQEMNEASSCLVSALHLNGVAWSTVPYGKESMHYRNTATRRCHDCGVMPGGHHHPGCDWAECPRCHQQLLICGCPFDEFSQEAGAS